MSTIRPADCSSQPLARLDGSANAPRTKGAEAPQETFTPSGESPESEWTVLIYMNGNNNLSEQAKAKLDYQLRDIEKSGRMNIVVQHSALRTKGWHHPNAINSVRYEVGNHSLKKLDELGPLNMGSEDIFAQFVSWGIKKYPAKHILVVMQGHGGAWTGGMPDKVHNDRMTILEMDNAYSKIEAETGRHPDAIAHDMCLMDNMEVAFQLDGHANVMIGSEEVESGMDSPYAQDVSAPYKEIFDGVSRKLDAGMAVDEKILATDWVEACKGKWTTPTQAAYDLSHVKVLARALDRLAQRILDKKIPMSVAKDIALDTKNMHDGEASQYAKEESHSFHLKDLHEFCDKLSCDPRIQDPDIRDAARDVQRKLKKVVFAQEAGTDYNVSSPIKYSDAAPISAHHEGERNHGMSIFIPTNKKIMEFLEKAEEYPAKYRDTSFAQQTSWGKLVEALTAE
jgi:hypothetical protein